MSETQAPDGVLEDEATLTDEEISTRPVGPTAAAADDSGDTADEPGGDTGDDAGDDSGDPSDTADTGDDSGDGS